MRNRIFKYFTVISLLFFSIIAVAICGCRSQNHSETPQSATYSVTYLDGTEVFTVDTVKDGNYANNYDIGKIGYTFCGWYSGNEPFDFSSPINCNLSLTAVWTEAVYTVTFIADGKTIDEIQTTSAEYGNLIKPAVPDKQHYTGAWEEVSFGSNLAVTVNANYTPVGYTVTLLIGNEIYEIQYNVSSAPELPAPPKKIGYSAHWDGLPLDGGNKELHLTYTPVSYTVNFIADNTICNTRNGYTVETQLDYPAVPSKDHYTAKWSELNIPKNNETLINVYAEYTPITYFATFIAENNQIAKLPFDIENTEITPPAVPTKTGYSADWESYDAVLENFTVEAVYTPIDYTATFIAGNKKVDEVKFNIENMTVTPPEVPAKRGYAGEWQQYELDLRDITVYADYLLTFKDEFKYKLSGDKTYYTVTGYSGSENYIIIPATHNGLPVKAVGDNAFVSKEYTYIEIQNNIEHIGQCAFQACTAFEDLVLPDTLKTIGDYAFQYNKFESIILPDSVESIGEYAFSNSELKNIKLSDGLISIGERCFQSCEKLTEITIPHNVETIGKHAFIDCKMLERAIFDDCTAAVGEYMFKNCINLSSVSLGNSMTKISEYAFENCSSLTSLVIPINIKYLAGNALADAKLSKVYIEGDDEWSWYDRSDDVFRIGYASRLQLIDPTDAAYLISRDKTRYVWKRGNGK